MRPSPLEYAKNERCLLVDAANPPRVIPTSYLKICDMERLARLAEAPLPGLLLLPFLLVVGGCGWSLLQMGNAGITSDLLDWGALATAQDYWEASEICSQWSRCLGA